MRLDAHQHYWKLERGDYGWLTPDIKGLYRDYEPKDLLPSLKQQSIDKTIVVQAAATLEETEYMLSLADQNETIAGVVGWVDLSDTNWRQHLEQFRKHSKFVGFRIMIQDMPDASVVLEPAYIKALQEIEADDLPVDLLLKSDQLHVLTELMKHVPHLRGVIDHIAKPRIAEGIIEPWASQMKELAQYPNLFCKLSGMVTEADHTHWKQADFDEYIELCVTYFGVERIMFGSDWPVCLLAAGYEDVVNVLTRALPAEFTREDEDKLFGANALRFYKLDLR
ncbi:amidohydrolase family protein [Paenibacillus marinisediminis]